MPPLPLHLQLLHLQGQEGVAAHRAAVASGENNRGMFGAKRQKERRGKGTYLLSFIDDEVMNRRPRSSSPLTSFLLIQASRAGYPSVAHYLISTKQKVQVDSAEMTPEPQPTSGGNNSVPRRTTKSSSKSSGVGAQDVNLCAAEEGGVVGQEKPQVVATVQTGKGIQRKVKKYFRGIKPTSAMVQTPQKSGAGEKNKAGSSHTTP